MPRKKNHSAMRMLGGMLQVARRAAGYTQAALAEKVLMNEQTIASIEQGRRALMPDLADQLDEILDTRGMLAMGVARLPEIDQFPVHAEDYEYNEREAITLSRWDDVVVPGLLQTEAYARAVYASRVPAFTEEEISGLVASRLMRQDVIQRATPPTMSFVIWEPALLFPLGGRDVHREQIECLRRAVDNPHITVQVLPLNRPQHAGTAGAFTLMETVDHQHLAYASSQQGGRLVATPERVSVLARKYAMLRSQALTPLETLVLLDGMPGEL